MVSIILPNFNHATFLRQRVESILNQTYQDFELIILDDCSTDNSRKILENLRSHPKVSHVIYNEKNSGSTFKQWEKGIELARGEFIWIAESDDISDKDFLLTAVSILIKEKKVGLVYTQSITIDENGSPGKSWIFHTDYLDRDLWKHDFIMNGFTFAEKYMFFQNSIPNSSAVVFRKKTYEKANSIDSRFTINGDWDLYTRILKISDIAFINNYLNYFREHNNKGSSKNIAKGKNIIEYYWLLKKWKSLYSISSAEMRKLSQHIFDIWYMQSRKSIKEMLFNNFTSIISSGYRIDRKIFFKLLKKMVS